MEYITIWHTSHINVCKISTSHLIGFTTTTSCRLGHCLIAAMYGMLCMIAKDPKKIWQSVRVGRIQIQILSSRTTLLGTNHCFRPPEADVPSEFSAENNNWLFLGRNLSIPMYKKTETDYRIEDGGR